jgi:putative transposase
LGAVVDGEMILSDHGRIAEDAWRWLAERHPYVTLDAWVVMPNHLHGIIVIEDVSAGCSRTAPIARNVPLDGRGASRSAPTESNASKERKPLGRLIGAFKTVSTKRINELRGTPGQVFWQRNYYERAIRNHRELDAIREYIANNPLHWELDQENPGSTRARG